MDDLLAFMKRLGTNFAPGVDDSTVRIGTFLPRHGPTMETGQAMRAVMAAYFAEINRQGGLYGRRVELVALDIGKDSSEAPKQAHDSLAQVLAVVGALVAGAEAELLPLLEGQAVPLVGPVTLFPQLRESAKASTFYLLAGVREQAAALAEFAGRRLEMRNARVAVVQPLGGLFEGVAGAVLSRTDNFGWTSAGTLTYQRFDAAVLVRRLADQKVDLVFFFGSSAELEAFQKQADRSGWSPSLFTSGSLSGMPSAGGGAATAPQVSVAYPMLPSDQSAAGRAELHALHVRYGLPEKHLPAQIYALSAAKVLVEGLKRAGRELTRERLVDALEQLDRFDTGLTPRISFGPNRRIGAAGAHVVAAKAPAARAGPADTWVLLDPP